MRPPAPNAVIFDMDGLLLDSERPIRDGWFAVCKALGLPLTPSDYLDMVGRNRADSLALIAPRLGASVDQVREINVQVDAWVAEHLAGQGGAFTVKPGAHELLAALRALGLPLAVASSTRRAEVERRLERAGLRGYFDQINGGDEVSRSKPAPDLFWLAAQRLGHAPEGLWVFEDSSLGAQGALAAGMAVVMVPDLKAPDPALLPHVTVLPSLADALTRWLPQWAPSPH